MKNNPVYRYFTLNLLHPRVLKFFIIGASGILVNFSVLYVLTEFFNIHYLISSIFAIETSILTNFLLNNIWTWKDRRKKNFFHRLLQYHISTWITGILANWLLLLFFTEIVGLYYLLSNLIGIGIGTISNFIINDLWTFQEKNKST